MSTFRGFGCSVRPGRLGLALVISITLLALLLGGASNAAITRGPYLQTGGTNRAIVRWRTDVATDTRVRFGLTLGNLGSVADDVALTNEHIALITNLTPATTYYYSIGTIAQPLASDSNFFFVTSPPVGTPKPTRVWVLGDAGSQNNDQRNVRNAFTNWAAARMPDFILQLGDNAYANGLDSEYQGAWFTMYPDVLRNTFLWPCLGNHDTAQATNIADFPYLHIFSFPTNGECGGLPSGSPRYYSFDYANLHVVVLDSQTSSRATHGLMLTWLRQDLLATTQQWVVACWHHPPYSKGTSDSDTTAQLIDIRTNFNPVLEEGGVDLVLCGHSHDFERSLFIDRHYGFSTTFSPTNIVQTGSGRTNQGGAYYKPDGRLPHSGTVYCVAGTAGWSGGGSLNHPAMCVETNSFGSVALDFNGNRLDLSFITTNRAVQDSFTLIKVPPPNLAITPAGAGALKLQFSGMPGRTYRIQYAAAPADSSWQPLGSATADSAGLIQFYDTTAAGSFQRFYRAVSP